MAVSGTVPRGPLQVDDDAPLLAMMLSDESAAPACYRSTNYWSVYAQALVPEIRALGLNDFRRRRGSVLSHFGATDLRLSPAQLPVQRRWPLRCLAKPYQEKLLAMLWPLVYARKRTKWLASFYQAAADYGEQCGAKPLSSLSGSLAGNPEEVWQQAAGRYPVSLFNYYMQYAFCCQFVDFDQLQLLVELGPGCGKQVEVLRRLHLRLTIVLFDVTPQLYVAEQYLKAVFGNEVVSYRDTRVGLGADMLRPGRVYICGAWAFPTIRKLSVDLFWNSASFQEMEPDVVATCLNSVRLSCQRVYLRQQGAGQWVTADPAKGGVLKPVTFSDYVNGLRGYRLRHCLRSKAVGYSDLVFRDYYDLFWERD
jgi:putative sugar O-methyltransferase